MFPLLKGRGRGRRGGGFLAAGGGEGEGSVLRASSPLHPESISPHTELQVSPLGEAQSFMGTGLCLSHGGEVSVDF